MDELDLVTRLTTLEESSCHQQPFNNYPREPFLGCNATTTTNLNAKVIADRGFSCLKPLDD